MKLFHAFVLFLLGGVDAFAVQKRDSADSPGPMGPQGHHDSHNGHRPPPHRPTPTPTPTPAFVPKTKDPRFFNLQVDDLCSFPNNGPPPCPLASYAIRLVKGEVIATAYHQGYDGALPMFFVDDDSQIYSVSKEPLQLYVDEVDGALLYAKVGWVPPDAIAIGFFHTGTNPLGVMHPSSSYFTWPSTFGTSIAGTWTLCPYGSTGQYKVYVDFNNFTPQGVSIDTSLCSSEMLAAIDTNPWAQQTSTSNKPPKRAEIESPES